jgi:sugar lactone lactonase YvrE
MNKHVILFMLVVLMGTAPLYSQAQCTATMTTSSSCGVPATLRVETDFVPYRIEWKRDGNTIRNDSGSWSSSVTTVAARGEEVGGVWVDKAGRVYYVGGRTGAVYRYAQQGAATGTVVAAGGTGSALNQLGTAAGGIVLDSKDTMYVTDQNNRRIMKYAPNQTGSSISGTVAAGPPAPDNSSGNGANRLSGPYDVALDGDGNIYVADFGNHRVMKFPPGSGANTNGVVVAGVTGVSGPGETHLHHPIGVHVDKNGFLYVADLSNQRIIRFPPGSTSGTAGTVVAGGNGSGTALNQFSRARSVFVDGYGNIYVVDDNVPSPNRSRLLVFPPNSTRNTMGRELGSAGTFAFGGGHIVVSDSGHVFYGDYGGNAIKKISASTPKDTLTANQAGTYTATVYGYNGCVEIATIVVAAAGGPSITPGSNPSVCAGATSASLSYSNATGSPNQYSITWSGAAPGAGFTPVTNQSLSGGSISITIPAGATAGNTYTGVLTVRNSTTGCVSSNYNISVSVTAGVTITLGSNPAVCDGATTASLPYTATGTPNQYSIAWSGAAPGAGFTAVTNQSLPGGSISIAVPATAGPGTYTGTLTMRNSTSGCVSTASNFSVVVNPLPAATVTPAGPVEICVGQTETLTASSGTGYSYEWKDAQGVVGSGSSYAAGASGDYYVVVTDGNNCKDSSATVLVTQVPLPQVSITPVDTSFCIGGFVRLEAVTADTGLSYQWKKDNAQIPATADFLEVNATGAYSVVVTRNNVAGCTDSAADVQVTVHPLPTPSIDWDGTLLTTDDYYDSYQWLISGQPIVTATGASYQPDTVGSYSVTVTDSNGCTSTSSSYQVNELTSGVKIIDAQNIAIYPNPATQQVYISGPTDIRVMLRGLDGRLLYRMEQSGMMDISVLPEGIYLLQVYGVDGQMLKNERLIKLNQ